MKHSFNTPIRKFALLVFCGIFLLSGAACKFSLFDWPAGNGNNHTPQPPTPALPTPTPLPQAQVTFHVVLPAPLAPTESLALRVLDEVTGLGFNYTDHPLQARDALNYSAVLPFPVNSVLKYRYVRTGGPGTPEYNALNQPLRYRVYFVSGASETTDIIAAWPDRPFSGQVGAMQGTVTNADNAAPIAGLMVSAGGIQALTDSAGRFNLQGLPAGTHNLVAFALDGSYSTFQQGATVAAGLTTPVLVGVRPAPLAPVTFMVHVPDHTLEGAPLRMAGNLLQFGNTFADLRGGLSVIAERMPQMNAAGPRMFTYTVNLPVGADLRYKYTLGDGLWNAEHKGDGRFNLRQLIIPAGGAVIEETVETWKSSAAAPISFEVVVPANTPAGDIVYIQFNPYGWTEPIPMWYVRENTWRFKLYSPLNLDTIHYRYCRNAQCGSADDLATPGLSPSGRQASTALTEQDIRDTITGWTWTNPAPASLVGTNVIVRGGAFMAGVEFQPYYQPDWSAFTDTAMQNIQQIGANWVILDPSWTYSSANPLVFGATPGNDPLLPDIDAMLTQARARGLNVALFPQPRFSSNASDWWRTAPRDPTWWGLWFDYYRAYAVHFADEATRSGAQALILGGDWIGPALPGGTLSDGNPSGVPADAEARWQAILAEVRGHFRGQLLWALSYTPPNVVTPTFISATDGVYLLISGNLSENAAPSRDELAQASAQLLDNGVGPLQAVLGKPVYLAFAYPSIYGATKNCLPAQGAACLDWKALSQPNAERGEISLNLQLQADVYEALFAAVNTRPWVSGVVSRGYYPPTLLADKSASVHGKPAQDVLWYWYQRLLGMIR
ncbi:MAG: hypothetical protein HFACDABA_01098 [Anaerolineales bacterium]|nr:hypothetical protein [Anaerolineales bacterium]